MRVNNWKPAPGLLLLWGMMEASAAQQAINTLEPVVVTSTRLSTSELETPASVSLIDGAQMRETTLGVNLSESMGGIPGLQLQNRENYAQDLQLSIRGFGARSTFGVRGVRLYVDGIPATMPVTKPMETVARGRGLNKGCSGGEGPAEAVQATP